MIRALLLALPAFLLLGSGRAEEAPAPASFPASWAGTWRGPSRSVSPGGQTTRFATELRIAPIEGEEAWTWTVIYGAGEKRQVRPYRLVPVDAAKGHWRIDERNGIVLDAFLVEDTLFARFAVMANVIEMRYQMRPDGLDTELSTFGARPISETGGEGRIPKVASFGLRAVQRARLEKVVEESR